MKQFIIDNLIHYLTYQDFINLLITHKFPNYYTQLYKEKSKIIIRFLTKNRILGLASFDELCEKNQLTNKGVRKMYLYYNPYISSFLQLNNNWKDEIKLRYFTKDVLVQKYTKYEVYYMMKRLSIEEIFTIGW